MADSVTVFKNRLQSQIKQLPYLRPEQKIQLITFLARTIDEYAATLQDPFKDLTDQINPILGKVEKHEKTMSTLIDEIREIITDSKKPVKDTSLYKNVKVGTSHRVVIKELPIGTVCTKKLYRTKRPKTCPHCKGEGCPECNGTGETHPIRAVLLEVVG